MKTGTKTVLAASALCAAAVFLNIFKNNKKTHSHVVWDPSKFENRLKEFFFEEDLTKAIEQYLFLIDIGLNPRDAYEIVRTKI